MARVQSAEYQARLSMQFRVRRGMFDVAGVRRTIGEAQFRALNKAGHDVREATKRAIGQRLAELHAEFGRPDCIAMPVALTDGRLMLSADILTAIEPGGWLHEMWEAADKEVLLPAVEVVPIADAVALMPQPQEP